MNFRKDPATGLTDFQCRILAALVVHGGVVTSESGIAMKRLYEVTHNPMNQGKSSFNSNVRGLETKGLVVRDLRDPEYHLPNGYPTYKCYAVGLNVEPSELPAIISSQYVPEIKKANKGLRASGKAAPVAEKKTENETIPTATKGELATAREVGAPIVKTPDVEFTPPAPNEMDALADALLDKVIARATADSTATAELRKHIETLSADLATANRQLSQQKAAQHNLDTLTNRVKELGDENERLKRQLAKMLSEAPGRRHNATMDDIINLVRPEAREAFSRMITERPNGVHASSARPIGRG